MRSAALGLLVIILFRTAFVPNYAGLVLGILIIAGIELSAWLYKKHLDRKVGV